MVKTAVVLFNLGGPDSKEAVEPFLFNLFNDKAIISLPQPLRWFIARMISHRRAPIAVEIYDKIGGKSPILEETQKQAEALENILGVNHKVFICMRYWHPMAQATLKEVKDWNPDKVILLPLYPQFSTTTSRSSLNQWKKEAQKQGLKAPAYSICCYPEAEGFVESYAELLQKKLDKIADKASIRILFSAHGLPQKIVDAGDPYQWQVERTAAAIMRSLIASPEKAWAQAEAVDPGFRREGGWDWKVTYQSKVGPLKWLEPATDAEIIQAAKDKKNIVIVPLAFVSEHSETLVELDMEYAHLAQEYGASGYHRVATVGTSSKFISTLAEMCERIDARKMICSNEGQRICPKTFNQCACV